MDNISSHALVSFSPLIHAMLNCPPSSFLPFFLSFFLSFFFFFPLLLMRASFACRPWCFHLLYCLFIKNKFKKKRRGLRERKILGRFSVVHQTFVGSPYSISFFFCLLFFNSKSFISFHHVVTYQGYTHNSLIKIKQTKSSFYFP